jgi:hypothetical protein
MSKEIAMNIRYLNTLAGGTRHCLGHYIKVIKCITQLMLGLFVDERRNSWVRGKASR